MLDKNFLEDYIKKNNIPDNKRRYLTEYLQAEILQILSESKYGTHLSFLGGTCLRFVHKINRFSEDLDFDLIKKGLDFDELAKYLEKKLTQRGFLVDTRAKKTENIIIIFIKFSEVMKQLGLSDFSDQKIKIKFEVDLTPFGHIQYESKIISSYGKIFNITSNTLPTLFAQKIIALKFRPYQKGRDFYDLVWFLAQKIEPNYGVLGEKSMAVENKRQLKEELEKIIVASNLEQAKKDVAPFLFSPAEADWILGLPKMVEGM